MADRGRTVGRPPRGTRARPRRRAGGPAGARRRPWFPGPPRNLLAPLPRRLREEAIDLILRVGTVRIERIVSTGQSSPPGFWYDQAEAEWVVVLRGRAAITFARGSETVELGPGDHVFIPAHERHRVEWTARGRPTVWLAVFVPPDQGHG